MLVAGGGDVFNRKQVFGCDVVTPEAGDLTIRAKPARAADHDRILADRREVHELVRDLAAHHPDVGLHRERVDAAPREDAMVRLVVTVVLQVETGLVAVEAVAVLHDELANANEPRTRTRVVAPLRLQVVDESGELTVAANLLADEVAHRLLVRHREDHIAVLSVLEPGELGTDHVPPPRILPDLGGVDDRHEQLLSPDPPHLFADDRVDLLDHAPPDREIAEYAGAELSDAPGAKQ